MIDNGEPSAEFRSRELVKELNREPVPARVEEAARQVVDAALAVHRALGPGLLESVYEICLAHALRKRGLCVERQVVVAIEYDGIRIESGFRLDLLVDDCLIVESKAVDALTKTHEAQLLTYLKLTHRRLGLLINFNVPLIRDGIVRLIR